mmetsp:Transcript_30741/g.47143  ORF Transcript_30741/g.47143 Transcript_30741/m.47143 type:complete len:240 (+) Transcript_30741:407-1126(+)
MQNVIQRKKTIDPPNPSRRGRLNSREEPHTFQPRCIRFKLQIKDSGIGIQKENIGNLFVNFGKLADNENINPTGTGLGLSICKSIVENMGGQVSVESQWQAGSTFNVHLNAYCRERVLKPKLPKVTSQGNLDLPYLKQKDFIVGGVPISPQAKRRSLVSDLNPIKPAEDIESSRQDMMSKLKEQKMKAIKLENPKFKCLAANDSDFQLMAMEYNLKKCNIEVLKAQNGFQAVELAKIHI